MTDKSDEYSKYAAECLHLGSREASIERRALLLQIVEAWVNVEARVRKAPSARSLRTSSFKMKGRGDQQRGLTSTQRSRNISRAAARTRSA
jgi:hypothetical protein